MKKIIVFSTFFLMSLAWVKIEGKSMQNKHIVVVILEAKPGSEDVLKNELLKVKKLSKQEPTCIEYRIHQDINNPTKFVLYENWTSKEDHAKQFQKPYILEFGNMLQDLLAKPYEGMMAKELN